jgi:hypothetical protein
MIAQIKTCKESDPAPLAVRVRSLSLASDGDLSTGLGEKMIHPCGTKLDQQAMRTFLQGCKTLGLKLVEVIRGTVWPPDPVFERRKHPLAFEAELLFRGP